MVYILEEEYTTKLAASAAIQRVNRYLPGKPVSGSKQEFHFVWRMSSSMFQ